MGRLYQEKNGILQNLDEPYLGVDSGRRGHGLTVGQNKCGVDIPLVSTSWGHSDGHCLRAKVTEIVGQNIIASVARSILGKP